MSTVKTSLFSRPASEQASFWIVSALCVFAVFWFALLSPSLSELQELRGALTLSEEAIKQESQVREQLGTLEKASAEEVRVQAEFQSRLASGTEVETLLGSISQAARDSNLSVRSIEQQREIVGDLFAEVPLRITISGGYSQVEEFFTRVSSQPKLVIVTRFDAHEPVVDGERVSLSVDCYISVFRALAVGEARPSRKR